MALVIAGATFGHTCSLSVCLFVYVEAELSPLQQCSFGKVWDTLVHGSMQMPDPELPDRKQWCSGAGMTASLQRMLGEGTRTLPAGPFYPLSRTTWPWLGFPRLLQRSSTLQEAENVGRVTSHSFSRLFSNTKGDHCLSEELNLLFGKPNSFWEALERSWVLR